MPVLKLKLLFLDYIFSQWLSFTRVLFCYYIIFILYTNVNLTKLLETQRDIFCINSHCWYEIVHVTITTLVSGFKSNLAEWWTVLLIQISVFYFQWFTPFSECCGVRYSVINPYIKIYFTQKTNQNVPF